MSHNTASEPTPKTIHRQMTIQEILSMFPNKAQRLSQEITNAGLHCVGCHAATWETLEAGMYGHGLPESAIEQLVGRLNALLMEQSSEQQADRKEVTLTAQAAEKFLEFAEQEGKQGYGLRFSDKADGCSGFSYELDFAEKAGPNDVTFVSQGIEIYVDKSRLERLGGSVIGYHNGLSSSGFKIDNPHVSSSCGCGSSHGYSNKSQNEQKSGGGCCSAPTQESSAQKSGGCCSKPAPAQPSHSHSHGGGCCSKPATPAPAPHSHSHGGGCCGGH
jgi:iron-sulfur cluster assembly accessory protein